MLAMVIDDSRAMRMILKRVLVQVGYEVWEAANGREALELLTASADGPTPDVAMVDWNMPEMNGLDFVTFASTERFVATSK